MSFRIAIDQDPRDTLDKLEITEWWVDRTGVASEGWLCPEAATKSKDTPDNRDGHRGSIDRAWNVTNWAQDNRDLAGILNRQISPPSRYGSYSLNMWLTWATLGSKTDTSSGLNPFYFKLESEIRQPASTPLVADGVRASVAPFAGSVPATDLYSPADSNSGTMCYLTIPRHGSRPPHVPRDQPFARPLPGAINVSFLDGHAEQIKLERLWQLYWHKDYVPPPKRPGLL